MSSETVLPELDVFQLPVFKGADAFPMIPPDEMAELAEDIKENGLHEPLVIGLVGDEWMLIDGRNRREACRIAEITPTYRVVEAEPEKLRSMVWSWNGPRRHMTSSQKAMAYALMFPETKRGMGAVSLFPNGNNDGVNKAVISRARFILKHDPEKAEFVRDGHPNFPLSKTYDDVKKEVETRKAAAEKQRQELERLTTLRAEFPELALLVDEGRNTLDEALATAESRKRKAAEEAQRIQQEEEARLAEEEKQRLEKERERAEIEKNIRLTLFNSFNDLVTGSTVWAGLEMTKERVKLLKDPQFEQERMQWPALQKFDRQTIQKAIDGLQSILEVY